MAANANREVANLPNLLAPQPMIKITVSATPEGPAKTFTVYKNFLTHYSGFFAKNHEIQGHNDEAKPLNIKLTDVDPLNFGIFVNWLMTQTVGNPVDYECLVEMGRLYVMGEKFEAPEFQNSIGNVLQPFLFNSFIREVAPEGLQALRDFIELAYQNECRELRSVVTWAAGIFHESVLKELYETMPKQMAIDLMLVLRRFYDLATPYGPAIYKNGHRYQRFFVKD